jgi:hypothetical protein
MTTGGQATPHRLRPGAPRHGRFADRWRERSRALIDGPPIDRWEVEIGQRRAEHLAAVIALLARTGATGTELAGALLPWLRALSDSQCAMLERELDVALAGLSEE